MNDKVLFFAFFAFIIEMFVRKIVYQKIHNRMFVNVAMFLMYLAVFVFVLEKY